MGGNEVVMLSFNQTGCDVAGIVNIDTEDAFNVDHDFSFVNHGSRIGRVCVI